MSRLSRTLTGIIVLIGFTACSGATEFNVSAQLSGELVLSGNLPDAETQTSLLNLAATMFPEKKVVNRLKLDGTQLSGWSRTARWGLSSLKRLTSGSLTIRENSLELSGIASDEATRSAINAATVGLKAGIRHNIMIEVANQNR